jgi:hypothetical protein
VYVKILQCVCVHFVCQKTVKHGDNLTVCVVCYIMTNVHFEYYVLNGDNCQNVLRQMVTIIHSVCCALNGDNTTLRMMCVE